MTGDSSAQKLHSRPSRPVGLTAQHVDKLWGVSKATGGGRLGLTARLSERRHAGRVEIARPSCAETHAISVWITGSTHSELRLDGKTRFSRIRNPETFQVARAGESVNTILTNRNGKCLDLYLPDSLLRECLERDFEKAASGFELLEVGVERDAEISRLAKTVLAELEAPNLAASALIDSATLALCVALIRGWSNRARTVSGSNSGLPAWKIKRVCDLISHSLAENLTLMDMAGSVGLSPYHFVRAFKTSVGLPPRAYQTQLRIRRVKELLETTTLSVTDIAAEVGYDDPGYLARLFRKHYGTTPAAYRRQRRS